MKKYIDNQDAISETSDMTNKYRLEIRSMEIQNGLPVCVAVRAGNQIYTTLRKAKACADAVNTQRGVKYSRASVVEVK